MIYIFFLIVYQTSITLFLSHSIHSVTLTPQNFFYADLLGKLLYFPGWFFLFCGALSTILIWKIAKIYLYNKFQFIPPFLFSVSMWQVYLVAGKANSIISLTLLLALTYTFILWKRHNISVLWSGFILLMLYFTSPLIGPIIWTILLLLIITGLIDSKEKVKLGVIVLVTYIPIITASLLNPPAIKNTLKQQVQIFSGPGLINDINSFQGEDLKFPQGKFAKLIDNKYVYLSEYTLSKMFRQITLSTYFTPQEKLLNFSFSSPIYLCFLLPFLYGLYLIIVKQRSYSKLLIISLPLIIPSLLSHQPIDLTKLILILPTIIFVISFALVNLINENSIISKLTILFILLLFFIQLVINILDIKYREYSRFVRYFGDNQTEVGKQ